MRLLADDINSVFGTITPPAQVKVFTDRGGGGGLSLFLTNLIALIYVVAGITFIFMIVFAGFQWITSGGDKEAIASARKRITWAIIGIVFLALAFFLINLVGQITGWDFLQTQNNFPTSGCTTVGQTNC